MKTTQEKSRKKRLRRARYWVVALGTMGMLVAYCPAKSHQVILGKARLSEDSTGQTPQQIQFDIPASNLETVFNAFQKISELQIVIPNEAMRAIASPGVTGRYSREQALREILRGTGIGYRFSDKQTVILQDSGKDRISRGKR